MQFFFMRLLASYYPYAYFCTTIHGNNRKIVEKVDSVAQLVEQYTFNVWVLGSNPSGITNSSFISIKTLKTARFEGFLFSFCFNISKFLHFSTLISTLFQYEVLCKALYQQAACTTKRDCCTLFSDHSRPRKDHGAHESLLAYRLFRCR